MAEVEDVARGGPTGLDDVADRLLEHLPRREDQRSSRGCPARPDPAGSARAAWSSGTRQSTPITSTPAVRHVGEDLAGARRRSGSAARRGRRSRRTPRVRVRQHVRAIVRRATRPPAQESKSCTADAPASTCTRRNPAEITDQLGHQRVPDLGRSEHHRLGLGVVLRLARLRSGTTPTCTGRRRTRSAACRRAQPLSALDRLGDEADLDGVEVRNRLDVGQVADRLRRSPGRLRRTMSRSTPIALSGSTMSLKKMRRIDAVAAHGLQGDLDDQVRRHARLEHADALAELAVLGQRAAGLAHEPHRRHATGGQPRAARIRALVGSDRSGVHARRSSHEGWTSAAASRPGAGVAEHLGSGSWPRATTSTRRRKNSGRLSISSDRRGCDRRSSARRCRHRSGSRRTRPR